MDNQANKDKSFKTCNVCGKTWHSMDDFINDPEIVTIGYQVNFNSLDLGFFLFNHSCKTTLAITAGKFKSLYTGEVYTENKKGTDECPGCCLRKDDMSRCPSKCECAYVREILQILKKEKVVEFDVLPS
jgi:hypothetical protein